MSSDKQGGLSTTDGASITAAIADRSEPRSSRRCNRTIFRSFVESISSRRTIRTLCVFLAPTKISGNIRNRSASAPFSSLSAEWHKEKIVSASASQLQRYRFWPRSVCPALVSAPKTKGNCWPGLSGPMRWRWSRPSQYCFCLSLLPRQSRNERQNCTGSHSSGDSRVDTHSHTPDSIIGCRAAALAAGAHGRIAGKNGSTVPLAGN